MFPVAVPVPTLPGGSNGSASGAVPHASSSADQSEDMDFQEVGGSSAAAAAGSWDYSDLIPQELKDLRQQLDYLKNIYEQKEEVMRGCIKFYNRAQDDCIHCSIVNEYIYDMYVGCMLFDCNSLL